MKKGESWSKDIFYRKGQKRIGLEFTRDQHTKRHGVHNLEIGDGEA